MDQLTSLLARVWRLRGPLFRAAFVGILWLFSVPHGGGGGAVLFAFVTLILYFLPFFRPAALLPQFGALFALSFFLSSSGINAIFLAILSFLLFGIKNLDIIERDVAYEMLVFLTLFLAAENILRTVPHWGTLVGTLSALSYAILFWVFARALPWEDGVKRERNKFLPVLLSFLAFELAMVLLFLPIEFISAACILFLFSVFSCFFLERHAEGRSTAAYLLKTFGAFALAAGFILVLSSWKI